MLAFGTRNQRTFGIRTTTEDFRDICVIRVPNFPKTRSRCPRRRLQSNTCAVPGAGSTFAPRTKISLAQKKNLDSIAGVALLGILTLAFLQDARISSAPHLVNPSFEPDRDGNSLQGWTTTGRTEIDAHTGKHHLTHPGGNGSLSSTQTLKNITNDWYTLKAQVYRQRK